MHALGSWSMVTAVWRHLSLFFGIEVRVYAQVGLDREKGFFVIGSDTPVYRDQRP